MSMVAIISDKRQKTTARQIAKFLEQNSHKVWELWRNKENLDPFEAIKSSVKQFSTIVLVFDQNDFYDDFIFKTYQLLFNHQKTIVLFLTSKIEQKLPYWFFLENHDYVNAFETSTDRALEALNNLIIELETQDNQSQKPVETSIPLHKESQKKNLTWLYVTLAVLAVIAVLLIFKQKHVQNSTNYQKVNNLPAQTYNQPQISSNPDKTLIGTWQLIDYKDNIPRQGQDLAAFNQQINKLKQNFRLTFNPNHTFVRIGFSAQPETGYWRIDNQTHTIILSKTPDGSGDRLKILTLTENQLIFEVASSDPQLGTIIVKFTLQKVK